MNFGRQSLLLLQLIQPFGSLQNYFSHELLSDPWVGKPLFLRLWVVVYQPLFIGLRLRLFLCNVCPRLFFMGGKSFTWSMRTGPLLPCGGLRLA